MRRILQKKKKEREEKAKARLQRSIAALQPMNFAGEVLAGDFFSANIDVFNEAFVCVQVKFWQVIFFVVLCFYIFTDFRCFKRSMRERRLQHAAVGGCSHDAL